MGFALSQYQRGDLNDGSGGAEGAVPGCQVITPISLPGTNTSRTYELDGLGNWHRTRYHEAGAIENMHELRQHNHLNQITRTKENSTEVGFSYDGATGDSNGNLTNDGVRSYTYDALNRLTEVFKDPNGTPTLIGTYTYDALGRRIRKVVSNNGLTGDITNGTTDFVYTGGGWRCCEERDGSNNPTKQYVWGIYIDELIQQRDDPDGTPVDRYMLSGLLCRGTALIDNTGAIVEAYDTDAYGNTIIFSAAGTGGNWWADDASTTNEPACQFIFTGRRYDPETQIYYYRARNYNPQLGRFIGRDPIGYVDGMSLYVSYFVMLGGYDPFGLEEEFERVADIGSGLDDSPKYHGPGSKVIQGSIGDATSRHDGEIGTVQRTHIRALKAKLDALSQQTDCYQLIVRRVTTNAMFNQAMTVKGAKVMAALHGGPLVDTASNARYIQRYNYGLSTYDMTKLDVSPVTIPRARFEGDPQTSVDLRACYAISIAEQMNKDANTAGNPQAVITGMRGSKGRTVLELAMITGLTQDLQALIDACNQRDKTCPGKIQPIIVLFGPDTVPDWSAHNRQVVKQGDVAAGRSPGVFDTEVYPDQAFFGTNLK